MARPMPQKPGTDEKRWRENQDRRRRRDGQDESPTTPPLPDEPGSLPVNTPPEPYGKMAEALLPYLSPEDSNVLESFYGFEQPDRAIPTEITGGLRNYYLSKERAGSALTALNNMKTASGRSDLGPGYAFLVNAIGLLNQFGAEGGEGLTRQGYSQFSSAIDSLMQMSQNDASLAPFANLAMMFVNPGFTAGRLVSQSKIGDKTVFGSAHSKLYT